MTNGSDGRRPLATMLPRREIAGEDALEDPEQQAAGERQRDAHEPAERRGRDRGDEQRGVVADQDLPVHGRDEHAGQAGDEAREHPGEHARRGWR